jgi:peroxiredoxin
MSDSTKSPPAGSSPAASPPGRPSSEPLILVGDRLPDFVLPDSGGVLRYLYDIAGTRPLVLVLVANSARQDQWDEIKGYADLAPAFESTGVDLVIVSNDGVESLALVSKVIPAPALWLADVKGVVNLALRTGAGFEASGVASFLVDSDQRVIALRGPEPGQAAWAYGAARALRAEAPLAMASNAPVLILPRALDLPTCRELLARCLPAPAPLPLAEGPLAQAVARQLLRRIGPEVDKVFSFDDFRFEGLSLGQDEAAPEALRRVERRRDNRDVEQGGRSFSLILDLDAEGYEGGAIRFPEYGAHAYRPETGAALVHAGGLLRLVEPVTAGRRNRLLLTLRRPPKPAS